MGALLMAGSISEQSESAAEACKAVIRRFKARSTRRHILLNRSVHRALRTSDIYLVPPFTTMASVAWSACSSTFLI